jgi:hypothetical protein
VSTSNTPVQSIVNYSWSSLLIPSILSPWAILSLKDLTLEYQYIAKSETYWQEFVIRKPNICLTFDIKLCSSELQSHVY